MNSNGASAAPQRNHVRWIVTCITLLGMFCIVGGAVLIFKGYNGDLLVGGALAAVSGLCGFLGAGRPQPPQPDITVTNPPLKTELKSSSSIPIVTKP